MLILYFFFNSIFISNRLSKTAVNLTIPATKVTMRQHPFDKLYIQIHKRGIFFCKGKSDNISTSADLTLFHVSMKVSVKFLCFSQSSSSLASLRSVVLQGIDFEIRYLAGIRFIDTAKYQGSKI